MCHRRAGDIDGPASLINGWESDHCFDWAGTFRQVGDRNGVPREPGSGDLVPGYARGPDVALRPGDVGTFRASYLLEQVWVRLSEAPIDQVDARPRVSQGRRGGGRSPHLREHVTVRAALECATSRRRCGRDE